MSFVRIDKPAGGPSDAVDQALAMARERLEHQYSTPNARIGPAASLIRDFSEVAAAGGSLQARAAAVFVRELTSRLSEDQLENIRHRVGQRTADIVALTHDSRWDGPTLAQRVCCRVKRIHRRGDAEARLVLERVALREADKLARNHKSLQPEIVAELASALRVIAESSQVDRSVAASVAELLASSGLVGVRWRHAPRHDDVDPRVLPVGCCRWDDYRPYLTWHRDLAALAEAMVSEVGDVLAGGELIDRRRRLHLTAEAWRAGRLSDADARSELAHLSPRSCEWIGTFEQLRRDDDEFVQDVRSWYWDEDPKDASIPDRLLDDFIKTIQEYGDA